MSGPIAKDTILAIKPYVPGKAKVPGFAAPLKLSANENALGCSPAARAAYLEAATSIHRYPDSRAAALRSAIARRHDLDPDRIILGAGSDEIFSLVCQSYLSPGDTMVQPQFAFAAWAIAARAAGAKVTSATESNYCVDVDALLEAISPSTRVVFLANPANPTGTLIPFCDIERLHGALPDNVVLVLDAAYAEFAENVPGYEDGMRLARTTPNVIVTRTFSKLHGLAALRIGWGYAAKPVIDVLERIRLPFNASAPAQASAIAALGDEDFIERSLVLVKAGREQLAALLVKAGLEPLPSAANFVTALSRRDPAAAQQIVSGLESHGVIVRGLANYDMGNALRVSVGTQEEMLIFEQALSSLQLAR
ncbi:MAG: histidinol-phosphate transaminase [Proteobacteria bacterium]|nr:histidinol-phosphate transaminase [Pseudomonadota bacterium]